jgi:hypothetical protein
MDEKELNNNTKYLELTQKEITKMKFICNAIDDGWKVKKIENKYIFSKHNSNNIEINNDNYLEVFLKKHFN